MPSSNIQTKNESIVVLTFNLPIYNNNSDNLYESDENYQVDEEVKDHFKEVIREIEMFSQAYEIVKEFGDSKITITNMITEAEIILKEIVESLNLYKEVIIEFKSKFSLANESDKIACEIKTILNQEIIQLGETYDFENTYAVAA